MEWDNEEEWKTVDNRSIFSHALLGRFEGHLITDVEELYGLLRILNCDGCTHQIFILRDNWIFVLWRPRSEPIGVESPSRSDMCGLQSCNTLPVRNGDPAIRGVASSPWKAISTFVKRSDDSDETRICPSSESPGRRQPCLLPSGLHLLHA